MAGVCVCGGGGGGHVRPERAWRESRPLKRDVRIPLECILVTYFTGTYSSTHIKVIVAVNPIHWISKHHQKFHLRS